MEASDSALLDRWLVHRDAAAFSELVSRHASMVCATCQRILRNRADAEEMAQECFISLIDRPPKPKAGYASLAGWLHKVAANKALTYLRGETRRRSREDCFARESLRPPEARWDDLQEYVDEAITALPDKLRYPIVSHFLEGESYASISRSLGIPRSTVATRVSKGIDEIRKQLKKHGVPVTTSALASFFTVTSSEAAPVTLIAALGKYALGAGQVSSSSAGILQTTSFLSGTLRIGGLIMTAKKLGVALAVLVGLIAAGFLFFRTPPHRQKTETDSSKKVSVVSAIVTRDTQPVDHIPAGKIGYDVVGPDPVEEEVVSVSPPEEEALEHGKITDPKRYCTVAGFVVDEAGNAIANADVMLVAQGFEEDDVTAATDLSDHHFRASANHDGSYEINEISYSGQTTVWASGEGFFGKTQVYLNPGSHQDKVDIIVSAVVVKGTVVDTAGKPVSGAQLFAEWFPKDEQTRQERAKAKTDDKGTFLLADVAPAGQRIYAYHPDYAPGWTSAKWSSTMDKGIEIVLSAGGTIEGVVTVDRIPLPNQRVFIENQNTLAETYTGVDGAYRLERVTPGKLFVAAESLVHSAIVEEGQVTVVDFKMTSEMGAVEGTVYARSKPVRKGQLRLVVTTDTGDCELFDTEIEADGQYQFDDVPAGNAAMQVSANLEDGTHLVKHETFTISKEGVTIHDVEFTLGPVLDVEVHHPEQVYFVDIIIFKGEVFLDELNMEIVQDLFPQIVVEAKEAKHRFEGLEPGTYTILGLFFPESPQGDSDRIAAAPFATEIVEVVQGEEIEINLYPE